MRSVLPVSALIPALALALSIGALAPNPAAAQSAGAAVKWSDNGLRLEIAPLTSDQVRAFFIGRGFSSENAKFIADTGCVFRSAIGNAGEVATSPKVTLDLNEWRITAKGARTAPRTRDDWAGIWKKRGAGEDAQTAFHWALFPTRQDYGPTDYNWGMITFALPPGTIFDLDIVWRTGGRKHIRKQEGLKCGV